MHDFVADFMIKKIATNKQTRIEQRLSENLVYQIKNQNRMDFWNKKVNVSKAAAEQQIAIINTFSDEKRMKIALDFANMSVDRTRDWIRENHPNYSELEVNLEWVKLMYFEQGEMSEAQWEFYKKEMEKKIRKDWAEVSYATQ